MTTPNDADRAGQHRRLSRLGRLYLWVARRLYHEFAWAYEGVAWLVSLGRWAAWRRLALAHVRGPRVVELGYGTGALLREMAERSWRVIGVDPSPAMARRAARRLRGRDSGTAKLRARAEALPLADGCADTIVSTFPAEYILSPATYREAARVLRAPRADGTGGGRFVIVGATVVAERGLARLLTRLLYGAEAPPDTSESLVALARPHGLWLRVIEAEAAGARVPLFLLEHATEEEQA